MDFRFDVTQVLRKRISVFTADSLPRHPALLERVMEIIDELGVSSAKAQGLRGPVTTSTKLCASPTHRVYLMKHEVPIDPPPPLPDPALEYEGLSDAPPRMVRRKRPLVIGMIKVGVKNLFLVDEYGRQLQISPLCVLDFYIHEDYQRRGCGRELFDYMLTIEMQRPGHLAYDRPSPKLLGFLRKHYGLIDYIQQPNNFVVYKEYGLAFLHIVLFPVKTAQAAQPLQNLYLHQLRKPRLHRHQPAHGRSQISVVNPARAPAEQAPAGETRHILRLSATPPQAHERRRCEEEEEEEEAQEQEEEERPALWPCERFHRRKSEAISFPPPEPPQTIDENTRLPALSQPSATAAANGYGTGIAGLTSLPLLGGPTTQTPRSVLQGRNCEGLTRTILTVTLLLVAQQQQG
ncbi:touch receptor neuron protein Mec-17-domain-containing protein [Geranomyces variabilis]|nr:touch receptor neuron protein Mec-17-domain-containing protein [Geranomyces variabilis]